jgi:glycosyltransferase involved in cell wall biosynthesis
MSEIKLSIVVVTHHRPNLLEKCLDAIEQQTLDKNKFEVIVVDNNSTDKTANLIYKYLHRNPHFIYYRETNTGFNYARNRGLKFAKGNYIAFIHDEVIVASDWCEKVLETFETVKPTPAVLTGEVKIWHDEEPPSWFVTSLEESKLASEAGFYNKGAAILKQMDYQCVIHVSEFEKQTKMKLTFHINQKYTHKINYRGMISEDPHFVNDQFLDVHAVWYDPQLLIYRYCQPRAFSFKHRRIHSYHQGLMHPSELTFSSFSKHLLHSIMMIPVLIVTYPVRWFLPKNEKIMLAIQSFSTDRGFLSKLFNRTPKTSE